MNCWVTLLSITTHTHTHIQKEQQDVDVDSDEDDADAAMREYYSKNTRQRNLSEAMDESNQSDEDASFGTMLEQNLKMSLDIPLASFMEAKVSAVKQTKF